MYSPGSSSSHAALSAHRFLLRAALSATAVFAWIFAFQYLYGIYGNIADAFVRVILLYELAQVITILLTPYAASRLKDGARSRMMAGVVLAMFALVIFGASLSGDIHPLVGLLSYAIFIGAYRAFYWTPYIIEHRVERNQTSIPQEIFLAFMPLVAGYSLISGPYAAAVLLFAGASILLVSIAPLIRVHETYEKFSWGYGETFAELFEPKHNRVIEPAFLEGLQGTALLLLWPIAVFILVGLSYEMLGLVLSATLLCAILFRQRGKRLLAGRDLMHATVAASSWMFRLAVISPISIVVVSAFASPTDTSADLHTLEQSSDNGTYVDEFTVLKEISMALGRIAMCIVAAVCITVFTVPIGIGVAFVLAAAASVVNHFHSKRVATI